MEARNETPDNKLELVNNTVPRFDFSELSWGDSMKLTEAQTIIAEMVALGGQQLTAADMRNMHTAFTNITVFLAKITVHVPRAWMVKDAPDNLDFSDPASFGHIKQKFIPKLMKAMNEAQAAEKNE
jgi:hypothetical protein